MSLRIPKQPRFIVTRNRTNESSQEKEFDGCGSYDTNIKAYLEKEFLDLNDELKSLKINDSLNRNNLIKAWLVACLAKTIKENINIPIQITDIEN